MKSFNEAITVIKTNISHYQKLCENANHQVLSDKEAFFRNLIPCGKQYSGQTGFQRANKFIAKVDTEIKKGNIATTEQLIDFAVNYPDKGYRLSDYIWQSIRETAGFTESHINYVVSIYMEMNTVEYKFAEYPPSADESHVAITRLFNRAIRGYYDAELLKYLGSYLGLESNKCADYGKKLLDHLDRKISQVEPTNKPRDDIYKTWYHSPLQKN